MIKILKNKKAILKIFGAIILLLFNGCSGFLDKNPLGKIDSSILNNIDAVDKLVVACYSPLNGYIRGTWGISSGPDNCFFGDLCGGNIHKGSTPGDLLDFMEMERFKETAVNGRILDKWILVYGGIVRCNSVLNAIEDNVIIDMSEADSIEIVAEMKFLRGYYHFEAKKIWNMVPYIDETVVKKDPEQRVANDKDIWPDIEADFSYAAENLSDSQEDYGRPTNTAAKAFLAEVYLFQQDYTRAKTLLDEVIASSKYKLNENFYDNFNPAKNNNNEVVWSNECAVNVAGVGYNRSQRGGDLSFPNAPDVPELSGAGFNQPSFDLVNSFKTSNNGLPLIDTYYSNDFKNDMGIASDDEYTPDMVTSVDPRLDWTVGRRGVPYQDWGIHPGKKWIRDQISAGPYNQKKYVIQKAQLAEYSYNNIAKFNAMNFNIIRYAEVLLWDAECEVEVGDPEKARAYVNMIRARARDGIYVRLGENAPFGDGSPAANYKVDEYTESWTGKSKEWMRERVRFEERLEFAEEGHQFFDLVRWGIAEQYINKYIAREKVHISYLNGVVFDANHCYFPIPLTEIDQSYKDGKPTLTQNPGY